MGYLNDRERDALSDAETCGGCCTSLDDAFRSVPEYGLVHQYSGGNDLADLVEAIIGRVLSGREQGAP